MLLAQASSAHGNDVCVCRVLHRVLCYLISTKVLSGSQTMMASPSLLKMNGFTWCWSNGERNSCFVLLTDKETQKILPQPPKGFLAQNENILH